MDDLKLVAKSEEELQKQIQTVKSSVMITVWSLDFKNVPRLRLRETN